MYPSRPVSLLPSPGKMLEKVVHNRISKFWEDNNFLSHNQGGFRKGFSTTSTIDQRSGVDSREASIKLQRSINLFTEWCTANALTVNIKKTKIMAFGSRNKVKKAKDVVISMGNQKLKQIPSYKYLGMLLDSTLNFNQHISYVIRTVLHKLILLSKLKRYLNDNTAITIYKSMMLPYFDYADVIFDKALNKDIKKLQTLQNKCLRICLGEERRFHADRAHKVTDTPFLKDRRKAHIRNFMYLRKNKKELLNVREIRTRAHDAPLFNLKIPRSEAFKRSVGYSGAKEWNQLPPAIQNTGSYLAFKNVQKKEMLRPLTRIVIN